MTSAPKKKTSARKPAAKKTTAAKPAAAKTAATAKAAPGDDAAARKDAAEAKAATAPPAGDKKAVGSEPSAGTDKAKAPPSGSGGTVVMAIAVALVLTGAGFATYPQWKPLADKLLAGPATTEPAPSAPEEATAAQGETPPPVAPETEPPAPAEAEAPAPAADPATATPPPDAAVAAALQSVTEKLAALEARLARLESAPAPAAPDVAPLAGKVAGLEDRLAAVDALGARLVQLEKKAAARPADGTLPLAVAALRDALRGDAPYRPALDALRPLAADDPVLSGILATLAPMADRGVATRAQLTASFADAAAEAARRRPVVDGDGWWRQAVNRLAGLVSIRKVDGATGPVDAALAAAERALATGDLKAAVAALSALDGAPADAVAAWRERATARLAVDAASAELALAAVRASGPRPASDAHPAPAE